MIRIDTNERDLAIRVVAEDFPIELTGKRTGHRWSLVASFDRHTVTVKQNLTMPQIRAMAEAIVAGDVSTASQEFKDLYEYYELSEKWPAVLGDLLKKSQVALAKLHRVSATTEPMLWLKRVAAILQISRDEIAAAALEHFGQVAYLATDFYPEPDAESALKKAA